MQPMAHKKRVPFTVFEKCQKSIIASKIEYEVDFWREMNDFQTLFCSALQMRRAIVFAIDLFWGWAMICTSSLYQIKLANQHFW